LYISKMAKHNEDKMRHSLELIKNLADMFIGVQVVGLPKRYLKHEFGESLLGIAGTTSSVIGLY
jgi:Peroxisomal biogenesis factor 11 (PEX11)